MDDGLTVQAVTPAKGGEGGCRNSAEGDDDGIDVWDDAAILKTFHAALRLHSPSSSENSKDGKDKVGIYADLNSSIPWRRRSLDPKSPQTEKPRKLQWKQQPSNNEPYGNNGKTKETPLAEDNIINDRASAENNDHYTVSQEHEWKQWQQQQWQQWQQQQWQQQQWQQQQYQQQQQDFPHGSSDPGYIQSNANQYASTENIWKNTDAYEASRESVFGFNSIPSPGRRPPWQGPGADHNPNQPQPLSLDPEDEALANLLQAWYYSGYMTGRYQAIREMQRKTRNNNSKSRHDRSNNE